MPIFIMTSLLFLLSGQGGVRPSIVNVSIRPIDRNCAEHAQFLRQYGCKTSQAAWPLDTLNVPRRSSVHSGGARAAVLDRRARQISAFRLFSIRRIAGGSIHPFLWRFLAAFGPGAAQIGRCLCR